MRILQFPMNRRGSEGSAGNGCSGVLRGVLCLTLIGVSQCVRVNVGSSTEWVSSRTSTVNLMRRHSIKQMPLGPNGNVKVPGAGSVTRRISDHINLVAEWRAGSENEFDCARYKTSLGRWRSGDKFWFTPEGGEPPSPVWHKLISTALELRGARMANVASVRVHIAGPVIRSGWYLVPARATVDELIEVAGGIDRASSQHPAAEGVFGLNVTRRQSRWTYIESDWTREEFAFERENSVFEEFENGDLILLQGLR